MIAVDDWPFPGDPNQYVGARHHTLPRFYMENWADADGNVLAIEKPGGRRYPARPKNIGAETDFYTYIDLDGNPAGHLEQALGHVETAAAAAIGRITHPVFGVFPPPPDDKHAIATLMAFQKVRGKRHRREIEQRADFLMKVQISGLDREGIERLLADRAVEVTDDGIAQMEEMVANLEEYEFVPDPNEHLRMLGSLSFEIFKRLMRRNWYLAEFSTPALITCDEPVLLYKVNPSPYRGYGVADADEIWFPLNPRQLLILAREPSPLPQRFAAPADFAGLVNHYVMHHAYQLIVAHPDHSDVVPDMPPDGPLTHVHAPAFPFAAEYNKPVKSRRTQRRSKR
jgi:hypothetical protein